MTRDEAVAIIQQQLGFRTTLSSEIVTNLKLAQTQLEAGPTKPWFLVSEDSYTDTEIGEQRIPFPTDFLEETDDAVFRYVPDEPSVSDPEVDLKKDIYDTLRRNYMDVTTGMIEEGPPEAYAALGEYFRIFPIPDAAYRLRMIYYKQDTVLSSNVENGWLKWNPFILIGKAGNMIAGGPLRDATAMQIFSQWEAEGHITLQRQNVAREMANRDMQVGGPH